MKKVEVYHWFCVFALVLLLWGCRTDDDEVISSTYQEITKGEGLDFFLLNEGNMGSNKASLDFCSPSQGYYRKNFYAEENPTVVQELGDVGNDIAIYGSRVYAVINCSNLVEVFDRNTFKQVGTFSIPNCRYVDFDGGYAYVSSYAGPVQIDPNARLGYVARVDTATLQVLDTCVVGYQPDEIAIADGKIYVANSGGYRVPDYDNTVSIIDIETFTVEQTLEVGINLHHCKSDGEGYLWVSSRGDYYDVPANLYRINVETLSIDTLDIEVSNYDICDGTLYYYGTLWSYVTSTNTITYGKVDIHSLAHTEGLISDGTDESIQIPYGIKVDPTTGNFYITDAKNYVIPGTLYCFDSQGVMQWKATTGDIPGHIAFRE